MSCRILHVLPSLDESHGGPLRLVLDLSSASLVHNVISEVVGIGPLRVKDNPLPHIYIHELQSSPWGRFGYCPHIRQWLRSNLHRFNGVVIHGSWHYLGSMSSEECVRTKTPYAYYPHGMLEEWAVNGQGTAKALKKKVYWQIIESNIVNNAVCVLFTTKLEWQLSESTVNITAPKRLLIPYGIDLNVPRVDRPDNALFVAPDGVRVALFLGRLHPKKNPDLLLHAWKQANVAKPWRLVVAGSGAPEYERELKSLAKRLQLDDSVFFPGFVSGADKQYLLQRADWFLLPSSQENFGIAVLEAVQNGCAVAISDRVYLKECFPADSEIMPVSLNAWAEFFSVRMVDEERRLRIRDGNQRHLANILQIQAVVDQWVKTFSELFAPL